ncbi:hypothetical protein [Microbispora sp. H10949]|uniref:hypothetical protein n=1 Tax=Microbispora sp. H10949 TaxID=2729111 RepID=UPI0016009F82|nr:hypothetical protein [Microbispora sp. H10949]
MFLPASLAVFLGVSLAVFLGVFLAVFFSVSRAAAPQCRTAVPGFRGPRTLTAC